MTMKLGVTAWALLLCVAGCGDDDSSPNPPPDGSIGGDAGEAGDAKRDVDPPTGEGDPCRGTPLPVDQHFVPSGLCARIVGKVPSTRQITFAPNGDLFATSATGVITRLHDANGDGVFDPSETATFANTGGNGNNSHIDVQAGFLYAGSPNGVKRFPWSPGSTSGGAGEDVVVEQPGDGNHPKHTVHVYDGYLYVHSGSSGNASNTSNAGQATYDTTRALLRRFKLADFTPGQPFKWLSGEIVSQGLRNMVGYTRNATGEMYGVVNGLDDVKYQGLDVHNDNPGEQVVHLTPGAKFGYPFCFTAQHVVRGADVVPPGTQLVNEIFPVSGVDDAWCAANSTKPTTFVQAHSAPLDIVFFDGDAPSGALPERWRGGAFVSMHGSWDRKPPTGFKVVWIPFDASGNAPMPTATDAGTTFPYEVVLGGGNAGGPVDGPWSWSAGDDGENTRPVGVAVGPIDGALYVSSDSGGYIYRIGIQK